LLWEGNTPAGNLSFGLEPLDQRGMRVLEGFLDESCEENVAAHVNVLADVEACERGADTELDGLGGIIRERAVDGPFVADCWYC
jgi:hypothetical protein